MITCTTGNPKRIRNVKDEKTHFWWVCCFAVFFSPLIHNVAYEEIKTNWKEKPFFLSVHLVFIDSINAEDQCQWCRRSLTLEPNPSAYWAFNLINNMLRRKWQWQHGFLWTIPSSSFTQLGFLILRCEGKTQRKEVRGYDDWALQSWNSTPTAVKARWFSPLANVHIYPITCFFLL